VPSFRVLRYLENPSTNRLYSASAAASFACGRFVFQFFTATLALAFMAVLALTWAGSILMLRKIPLLVKVSIAPLVAGLILLALLAWQAHITNTVKWDAAVINLAGSERMRLFKLVMLAEQYMAESKPQTRALIDKELTTFEIILRGLKHGDPRYNLRGTSEPELVAHLDKTMDEWNTRIKPLFQEVLAGPASKDILRTLHYQEEYATRLDGLVALLQAHSEKKIDALQNLLWVFLLASVLIASGSLIYVYTIVLKPIRALTETSRAIAAGDFSRTVPVVLSKDELGELASDFNEMSVRLKNHIGTLNRKTVDLQAQKALIEADRRAILGLKQYAEDIIASLPAGLLVLDSSLKVLSVNRSFRELFGRKNGEDLAGRELEDILPLPGLRPQAQGVLASGTAVLGIDAVLGEKQLHLAIAGIRLAEEEDRLLVVVEDVTAEQKLRVEARAHERRFHDLVQGLDAIVWEAEAKDGDLYFTFVSRRAEGLLGYPVERWLTEPVFWADRLHPEDREAVVSFYHGILKQDLDAPGESGEIEYRVRAADGREIWFHEAARAVADPAAPATRLCGVMMDITARKDMEARLVHLVSHDALTGLPNRNLLADRLSQALISATRHRRAAAVLFLDLDRFKFINDSLGHSMGDRLLQVVAERLSACVREGDTVARLGGDEFVIILEDMVRPRDAALLAQKMLDRFTLPFRVEDPVTGTQEFYFTASIGISLYPGDGEDAQTLLKNADVAMYRAKEHGGNNYQFFTAEMDTRARKRLSLENALHHALEQEQFVLHYQPQVELATGRVLGVEALLRWRHPEQGLIAPAEFIPLLEETGFIIPVGEWVLHTACAQHRAWREAGLPPLRMAVNLSARQLRHEHFVDTVAAALADAGMDPDDLELEITESAVMQQVEASLETLRRIHALGVQLSMDDFGTGYSSLGHLKLLPIDTVKIDQSFVRDIPGDENDAAIAQAIIVLTHGLQLKVIAEGVETKEQLEFLRTHGCDAMQGYLFSRPLPAAEITSLLKRGKSLPPGGRGGG
jgi:diguanylate cyclase (GGDEF)-like protein/PAS domain S-box-containing protein